MAIAIAFIICAIFLCAIAALGLLGVGQLALAGAAALERDGLARGTLAPAWELADSAGTRRSSPPATPLQLIVFADHSLRSFPSVVSGLRALRDSTGPDDLDVVVLTRGGLPGVPPALAELGLAGIAVVAGSARLYARYNVRVMPFAIFVADDRSVRAASLVNHDWQLARLHQIARLPLDARELAAQP